ncbi:MAG TPA: HYR domain-containing protein [Candidatus Limnocylindrales bacterium]|jgi:hypothetical protein|nr:HYR domain-containing protein [Candidatus Limnocylindrales bacterium]
MRNRVFKRAAMGAAALLLIGAAVAYADVINADADRISPSAQTMVDLGTVGPGATVTYNIYFLLECRNTTHAVPGSTITLTPQNPSPAPGGTISATATTIGPVPADWPGPGESCVGDPLLQSTTASTVTIVAPTVMDTGYIYRIEYGKSPTTGLTGITTMTFRLAVGANSTPVVTVPANQTVEGDTLGGWLANYSASATDVEDGPLAASCAPPSGSVLPVGLNTVTCTATDSAGATGSGSFQVLVTDTTAPVLSGVPAGLAVDTTDPTGATVDWPAPSAVDVVDGAVAVSCTPASGSHFAVGSTNVDCTASDFYGNAATGSFSVDVTLVDTTPPVLSGVPGDISVTTTDPAGAAVTWPAPSAVDNVDGPVPVTCAPASGSVFPVGRTTVDCSASDAHGNVATASFTVTVGLLDTSPPAISGMPGNIAVETADPTGAVVTWPAPSANDNVDGPVPVTCDPASGTRFPIGFTMVTCSASDAAGNATSGSFSVSVTLVDAGVVTATWEPPFGDESPFVANGRGTLPLKGEFTLNGEAVVPPAAPRLVLERSAECGGPVLETVDGGAFDWAGDRWTLQLRTGQLTPGCWRASVSIDGSVGGSIFILVGHGAEVPASSGDRNGTKTKTTP